MEKVFISESGPEVSAAIYGFWRWNKPNFVSQKNLEQIVNLNLELGVNTFDHSASYLDGKIESLFGNAISSRAVKREDIVLFSKAGIRKLNNKQLYYDLSADYIKKSIDSSLLRLKTDYIDVFLLEHYDPLCNIEETASEITKLLVSGKIKHIGVSNFNVFQHRLLASYLPRPIVTNHIELNLLNPSAIDDGRLDFIREQYSKPMAWSPLAGGKIENSKDKKTVLLRKTLKQIAQKHNANIEQIAVAWLYKLGALPIIGSTDKKRITNAASAYTIHLSKEEWYKLYQLSKEGL